MATLDIPSVTYDGENVAEVQEFLRARGSDATTMFDSTGMLCTLRAYDGDYPLAPGDVIIQDTAGSVFVMPRNPVGRLGRA